MHVQTHAYIAHAHGFWQGDAGPSFFLTPLLLFPVNLLYFVSFLYSLTSPRNSLYHQERVTAEILSCRKDTDLKKVTHCEHVNMAHWYFLFIFILFSRHPLCSDILHKITHQYLVRSYRKRWKLKKNHWRSPYRACFEVHLWIFGQGQHLLQPNLTDKSMWGLLFMVAIVTCNYRYRHISCVCVTLRQTSQLSVLCECFVFK